MSCLHNGTRSLGRDNMSEMAFRKVFSRVDKNTDEILRNVKEIKKLYSEVRRVESIVNRIQNITTTLMLSQFSGGAAAPLGPLQHLFKGPYPAFGIGPLQRTDTPIGPAPTAVIGMRGLASLGIVTALIPIMFQVAMEVAKMVAESERIRQIRERETTLRELAKEIFDEAERESKRRLREEYRSFIP